MASHNPADEWENKLPLWKAYPQDQAKGGN